MSKEISLKIKPLSVNQAWQGRRFKTGTYKEYEKAVSLLINDKHNPVKGLVEIDYEFGLCGKGFSSSDVSNLIKCLEDILVKCGVIEDDRKVMRFSASKVKSGTSEFINIKIKPYEN